jgi:hypothetical protein
MLGRISLLMLLATCAAGGSVVANAAPAKFSKTSSLVISSSVTPGNWRIQYADGPVKSICLKDILPLIQLAHPGIACSRLVIEDEAQKATIHYSCPGAGWGRTSLAVETSRLVQINSQGIAGNAPFAFEAEARRTGVCGDQTARVRP